MAQSLSLHQMADVTQSVPPRQQKSPTIVDRYDHISGAYHFPCEAEHERMEMCDALGNSTEAHVSIINNQSYTSEMVGFADLWGRLRLPCEAEYERMNTCPPQTNPSPAQQWRNETHRSTAINVGREELFRHTSTISEDPPSSSTSHSQNNRHQSKCVQFQAPEVPPEPVAQPAPQSVRKPATTPSAAAKETMLVMEWARQLAIEAARLAVEEERKVQRKEQFPLLLCKWKLDAMERAETGEGKNEQEEEDNMPSYEEEWLFHYLYEREKRNWMQAPKELLREKGDTDRRGLSLLLAEREYLKVSASCYVRY